MKVQNMCFYGMIQHTSVIIMQIFFFFVWHDVAYLSNYNANCMFLWYDMAYLSNYNAKFVFLWHDVAYLSNYNANCMFFVV